MAPIPSAPIHYDHLDLLIATEASYAGPTGALTFVPCRMWDVQLTPLEADEKELPYLQKFMGQRHADLLMRRTTLTGKVAFVGSAGGAGGIPLWDPLMRACGTARAQVAATPTATIAAAAVAGADADGAFTYTRTTAFAGVTDRVATLTCTTGGGSGVAAFTVAAPAAPGVPAWSQTGVVMTTAEAFPLPDGAEITPDAIGTPFTAGDSFTIALTAPGVAYVPSSDRSAHKSAVLRLIMPDPSGQDRVHEMLGTRGTIKMAGTVNDYPAFELSLTSFFTLPALDDPIGVDYGDWPDPVEVSTANTPACSLFGHDLVAESVGWDAGNTAELVERVGRREVRINDRKSTATLKVEETGLEEFDILAAVAARTIGPFVLQHGTTAGNAVRIEAPRAQLGKPSWSESKKDRMADLTLRLLPTAAGDDEWRVFVPAAPTP